jgi:hypothetical protein
MYVGRYVGMYVCRYVGMYVCMYVGMYVCMYINIYDTTQFYHFTRSITLVQQPTNLKD